MNHEGNSVYSGHYIMVGRAKDGQIRIVNDDDIYDIDGSRCTRCYGNCNWNCEAYYAVYKLCREAVSTRLVYSKPLPPILTCICGSGDCSLINVKKLRRTIHYKTMQYFL